MFAYNEINVKDNQTRLREKGILDTTRFGRGTYAFALPAFSEFVRNYHMDDSF